MKREIGLLGNDIFTGMCDKYPEIPTARRSFICANNCQLLTTHYFDDLYLALFNLTSLPHRIYLGSEKDTLTYLV